MSKLLHHRAFLRRNLFLLIGLCLGLYFCYHAVLGQRGLVQLYYLSHKIETMSLKADNLLTERMALEKRVVMMRPGSVDRDLLEERAQLVLGYHHKQDLAILEN